jgi:DNA-binding transcriptional MerR regulator
MDEIKKVYYTSKEVAEALGVSVTYVHKLADNIGLRYRGNQRNRKFTDYDLMKLKNKQLLK